MIVSDIMTREVLAIDPETPLVQAITLMTEHRISGLPVVGQNGQLVGILTEGDLMRRVETGTEGGRPGWFAGFFLSGREAQNYVQTHGRRAGEVMSTDVVTVTESTSLSEAVDLMRQHHVKRLPVLRDGRLCGIVSRADIVRQIGKTLQAAPVSVDDAAIMRAIRAAIVRENWVGSDMASISIKDGVVGLDGCLFDIRARAALGVLAENVPGVKRVENRIICIEQNTGAIIYDPALKTPMAL